MNCGKIDLRCTRCRLSMSRSQVVPGTGRCDSRVVLLGEAPGRDEDLRGEPFVGRAGRLLDDALEAAGARRANVYITNLVKCRPPKNRRPRKDEVGSCSMFLESEFATIRPKVVVALGQTAAERLLDARVRMAKVVGKEFTADFAGDETVLVVAYHPAGCLYNRKLLPVFRRSIRTGLELAGLV